MSPKPAPKFALPRRANADQDAAFAALEQRTEQRGNGVAGQPAAAETDVQIGVRTDAHLDVQKPAKAIVKRRGGRLRRRRTIYLPTDLDAALERFCFNSGREVSETVAGALELYLASKR